MAPTLVELVEIVTPDGVRLNGALAEPASRDRHRPFDAVLMMHGAANTFYESFFTHFADELTSRGYATLRANNRGHDYVNRGSASVPFLGSAFERLEDCALDWRAWIDFLARRGRRRVLLWGHSLGAVKSAWYLAHRTDARVGGCVLASPPRFNEHRWTASEAGADFAANLARAQTLVDAGTPEEVFTTTVPLASIASARAYIAKYASGTRYDVFGLLPRIACPVLAFTGENELGEMNFRDHVAEYAAARERKAGLEHVLVPGGGHDYSTARPFVLERLLAWIAAH